VASDGPPDACEKCGNENIDIRRDVGVYKWNYTCRECMFGNYRLNEGDRA